MQLPLRRALSTAASVRRARALHTAAASPPSRTPPWAMIYHTPPVRSTAPRATFLLAEPPCPSHIHVPDHLIDRRPSSDPDDGDTECLLGGLPSATSGDGLLLLTYVDMHSPAVASHITGAREHKLFALDNDPRITRFVCNPLTGELFRLPDIDGPKPRPSVGLLTRSDAGHGPPDRYAVALLNDDGSSNGEERAFTMWRFLSQRGEWEKLVGLPCRLPLPRKMCTSVEAVAFDGRLWWVDPTWGAISADPFSDRPELRFVELPRGSVWPGIVRADLVRIGGMYQRMGVSEGRLRYVELSEKYPFVLSSFALDDDGSGWTLEHRVALGRLCKEGISGGDHPSKQNNLRIGVIDPLNASVVCVLIGKLVVAVDMDMGKVLGCSPIDESFEDVPFIITAILKACVLPPWLGSSKIPCAVHLLYGMYKKIVYICNVPTNCELLIFFLWYNWSCRSIEGTPSSNNSKTLSDILVRVDRDKNS
uniref:DUF1618 domain-containing protein n=1 Tax=Leersia perrieri TaxID=77586 RepID=A0A0D9WEC6_9ORYZ